MAEPEDRPVPYRPGTISLFFVVKAGIFALAFWIWLLVLAIQGGQVAGWHLFAAAGAITTTLVGVGLGIRMALQANAADRHAEVRKTLVEISWNTAFAAHQAEDSDNVVRFPSVVPDDSGGWPARGDGDRRR
ncbi:hypothetical protein [Asanoa iriomotensis]|uniref:Uncharacterized protein n=1 Tax=Asanoa iriomotensis TaxID=234613 RepID=A0ABQ4C7J6_9ACTN|nr:hypothetical protein [Asanoa iriomotensis]GIF58745.1 hypothetical protein Air01nite_48400 [Asanoa iriomotensis]